MSLRGPRFATTIVTALLTLCGGVSTARAQFRVGDPNAAYGAGAAPGAGYGAVAGFRAPSSLIPITEQGSTALTSRTH